MRFARSLFQPLRSEFTPNAQRRFHTSPSPKMQIHPVPIPHTDNYAYVLLDDATGKAAFVDPWNVGAVRAKAKALGVKDDNVVGCLTTHHHNDHAGGNADFARAYPSRPIYGGSKQVLAATHIVKDGKTLRVGENVHIKALATPCHTQDSICYFVEDKSGGKEDRAVFTGDTLFIAGCGRFFEGTPAEMHRALNEVLASLPDDTKVENGHEYTTSNALFGASVLPDDPSILRLLAQAKTDPITTGKSTIGDEKRHNVFMRVSDPQVQQAVGADDPVEVMARLRQMKNSFKAKV